MTETTPHFGSHLTCDGPTCNAVFRWSQVRNPISQDSVRLLREAAEAAGWEILTIHGLVLDFCPHCKLVKSARGG